MKKSEFKAHLREEIISILQETTIVDKNTPSGEAANIAKSEKADITTVQSAISQAKQTGKPINVAEDIDSDEDEVEMDKKAMAGAKKGDSVSKVANKLAETTKEMKEVVKKWSTAEEPEKSKLLNRLKELTKIKKELEGLL